MLYSGLKNKTFQGVFPNKIRLCIFVGFIKLIKTGNITIFIDLVSENLNNRRFQFRNPKLVKYFKGYEEFCQVS